MDDDGDNLTVVIFEATSFQVVWARSNIPNNSNSWLDKIDYKAFELVRFLYVD